MSKHYKTRIAAFFCIPLLLLTVTVVSAQISIPGKPIVCYGGNTTHLNHLVPAKANLRQGQRLSKFEITYTGFPDEAKTAFQYAVSIWETMISSSVPIRISATWTSLDGSTLASTGAKRLYRGFAGAIQPDVWYPVALAEKITSDDLNPTTESDIEVSVNQDVRWYFGTDGQTPSSNLDMVSVILHEIAHGLGFISLADTENNNIGKLRDEKHLFIYDLLLENRSQVRLSSLPDSSQTLYRQFVGSAVYLHSPTAAQAISNRFPRVYTPTFFSRGTSLSHLDNTMFPYGDLNSLMTPSFSSGESVHIPGPVVLGVLADLGWVANPGNRDDIVVYPNPSTGVFTVTIPLYINTVRINVVDAVGKEVVYTGERTVPSPVNEIDLSTLPAGLYAMVITTPTGKIRRKLMVLR
jgi:hypothetical protein